MPKKEAFPIPLKNIDVIRATYTDLDVLQEKRFDEKLECGHESKFVRFSERIHEVHCIESETSQGIHVVQGEDKQKIKQLPDLKICF